MYYLLIYYLFYKFVLNNLSIILDVNLLNNGSAAFFSSRTYESELNITPCFAKNSRLLSFALVFYPETEKFLTRK